MNQEAQKLIKAKEILMKMANGINPVSGEEIENESFLHDPRIIRCLFFISDVLSKEAERQDNGIKLVPTEFIITPEEKCKVVFPDTKVGVTEFAKCINKVIDINRSKKLTGFELNKQLKRMGILSEKITDNGKKRTILNDKSQKYGIEIERRIYNDKDYEMVVFNEVGKKFLLDNLEKIIGYVGEEFI